MSMCRVFSCVVERRCLLWTVHSLGKTLSAFALLYSVLQGQICLLLRVFLDFLLLHSSPLWWKGHLFWVLVLEGLVGLHRTIQLQLLQRSWSGHSLGLPLILNGLPWKRTEIILSFWTVWAVSSGCTVLEWRAAERRYPTSKVRSGSCALLKKPWRDTPRPS